MYTAAFDRQAALELFALNWQAIDSMDLVTFVPGMITRDDVREYVNISNSWVELCVSSNN